MTVKPPAKHHALTAPYRWLLMLAASICLALGFIGVVVPGMPTTVFVLMAAWLAARSSPAFSAWLDNHRITGPIIHHWRNGRCMPRTAKYAAAIGMSVSVLIMALSPMNRWIFAAVVMLMLTVLVWLWRLPEPPEES